MNKKSQTALQCRRRRRRRMRRRPLVVAGRAHVTEIVYNEPIFSCSVLSDCVMQ